MTSSLHPGAQPGCPVCRGDGYSVERGGERAVARPCQCVGVCPDCKGTGFVAVSDGFRAPRRRCRCQVLLNRIRAFEEAGIPSRHAASSLTNFDRSGKRMKGYVGVSAWLKAWNPEGGNRGLVLWGEVGRGKTHLMVALLRDLVLQSGARGRFIEFSHLLADLRSGFDRGRGMAQLLDPLVKVDILAIDELGKGLRTDFELNVIDELVSRRYNAMLPILATTNYEPERATGRGRVNAAEVQLGTASAPTLADRVGDRVYSRLRETADFVELRGEDWRETHRGRAAL